MSKTVFEVVREYLSEKERSDIAEFALKFVRNERDRGIIHKTDANEMTATILCSYLGIPKINIPSNKWECWTLSEDDIKEVATDYDLSLEGKDIDEIARRARINWAIDEAWVKYVKEAIQTASVIKEDDDHISHRIIDETDERMEFVLSKIFDLV